MGKRRRARELSANLHPGISGLGKNLLNVRHSFCTLSIIRQSGGENRRWWDDGARNGTGCRSSHGGDRA